jgi:hypothetical protein
MPGMVWPAVSARRRQRSGFSERPVVQSVFNEQAHGTDA